MRPYLCSKEMEADVGMDAFADAHHNLITQWYVPYTALSQRNTL